MHTSFWDYLRSPNPGLNIQAFLENHDGETYTEAKKLIIEVMIQLHSQNLSIRKVNQVFGIKVSRKCVRENFFKWNQHVTIQNLNKGNSGVNSQ